MPNLKLAFVGYRREWERNWLAERLSDAVDFSAVPCDPTETIAERSAGIVADANIIVTWGYPLGDIHERPGELKLIQCMGAGTDGVPKVELHELGIPVAGNGGANSIAVAEWTVMLTIAALRKLTGLVGDLRQGRYNQPIYRDWEEYPDLTRKRVGLVGFGRIAQAVARRLAGWECEIVYCDQREIDPETQCACNAAPVPLDELMRTSDVVSVHTPLTARTRGLIDADRIGMMKGTAILVNTCRGPVVDEAALTAALQSGAIAGAGLDVTAVEPLPPDSPLLTMDNVFLTPHMAGISIEARQRAITFAAENANRLAAGDKPLGVVDPFE